MSTLNRIAFSSILAIAAFANADQPASPNAVGPVFATIETDLKTGGGHIRQFAFDGDADTYFASDQNAGRDHPLTLRLSKPVAIKSIAVMSGRPNGDDKLTAGTLEVSSDGKTFEPMAQFADGLARAELKDRKIAAIRVKPSADLTHPLVIREFTIASDPPVAAFKYPVEFTVNVDDAPEMKDWADKVARICFEQYPMINEELKSEGYKPPHQVTMTLKSDYRGVAATGGNRITGSVKFFKDHPDDIGAMVHETVHVVQRYRTRNNPGWLVEGIADYVRFYKYEPGKLRPLPPDRAIYSGSYKTSAQFLAFLTAKYDKEIVRKLNKAMREGEYKDEIWVTLTGKRLPELGDEWKASLGGQKQESPPVAAVKALVERNRGDAATSAFKFKNVPSPAKENLARKAKVTIVDGKIDGNSGGVNQVHDGELPSEEDEPAANFFFDQGAAGGRLAMDLGKAIEIRQINTYSWHPDTRGPQVYKLYASDGTAPEFKPEPKSGTDPAKVGWKLIASVDTRPKARDEMGGQYGVSIADPTGAAIGKFRHLLFAIARTEDDDPFGNTFYSEITVIEKK